MNEKKLVPKRRFKNFKSEWEKKSFGDYFNIVSGYAFKTSDYVFSGIPIINGESIQNGKIKLDDLNYLPESFCEKFNSFLVNTNDVVIGLNRPIINGKLKISLIPKDLNNSLLYQRAGKILNLKNMHSYFSYQLLEKEVLKFVKEESVGSDQPFISTTDLIKSKLSLPNNENEQQKIGEFFKVLDKRIANQERKIAKVKALKSAYLTEMFPQEGETIPKRRFKGFEGNWERVKLSEIADIIGGGTPSTSNEKYWNGNIDWYSPTEIGKQVYANKSEKTLTELGLQKSSATILPANRTILFTSRAGIGDMAILTTEAATNQGFQSLVLKNKVDTYFIYSMGYKIKNYALINASGSTFLEVSGKTLEKMVVILPSFEEQQKIGKFFKNLDDQIRTEEKKLEKLKKMKEAYLEEMFV
jgi:type I restriction enzyme S subunit